MRHVSIIFGLFLLFTSLTACKNVIAPIDPGSEPAVVNAERIASASLASYDAVTTFDHDNLDFMKTKMPAVHEQVQNLRKEFPDIYRAFRAATVAYKQNRTQQNLDAMNTALQKVQDQQKIATSALGAASLAKSREPGPSAAITRRRALLAA